MVVHIVSKLALVGMMVGIHSQAPAPKNDSLNAQSHRIDHFHRERHLGRILGHHGIPVLNQELLARNEIELYVKDYVTAKLSRRGFESQAETVLSAIFSSAHKHQVDPLFIVSMIEQESQFNLRALGRHGEIGLLQIKPKTAEWAATKLGIVLNHASELWDPHVNLNISVAYLKHLQSVFKRLPLSHLDAYNRGTGSVLRSQARGEIAPTEYSRSIVDRLLRHYRHLSVASN